MANANDHRVDLHKHPAVGVGVMVRNASKILLGRRRGAHGAGEYGWPGGSVGAPALDALRGRVTAHAKASKWK